MKDSEPVAVASKDKGERVTVVRKVCRLPAVVANDHSLDSRPRSVHRTGIDIHTRVPAQGRLGRVAVLADNI